MNAAPYGVVDFKTITNTKLSIQARGIYCYLACYANKMHKASPSRERILSELGLSKNGYYRHYHQLEDNGIMMIKRSMCKNNSYHLFFRKLTENQKYGFVYKAIMTDPKISLAARSEDCKLFIVVSDGQPADGGYYGTAAELDLQNIRKEYTNKGITFLAAAIGDVKPAIKRCYGESSFLDITDLREFPMTIAKLIARYAVG